MRYHIVKRLKSMYVSNEQQLESLPWITSMMSIWRYEQSLNALVWYKLLSRSRKHLLLKRFRKHIGMSYANWHNGRYGVDLESKRRPIEK